MKNNKILKKITAFLIATVFLISSMPLNIAFANLQGNVQDLRITGTNGNYNVNLTWKNPASWSSISDNSSGVEDGATIHKPEGFRIYEKQAKNQGAAEQLIETKNGDNVTEAQLNRKLNDGSVYEYKVIPYHSHKYKQPDGTIITKEAPLDETTKPERVLFLTDIKVEATGSGNTLTVTFDNPKYEGKNLFDNYRIYYQQGGQNVGTFNSQRDINLESEDVLHFYDTIRGVDRITYKIVDNSLQPGSIYAVKVEPLVNGKNEIRNNSTIPDPTVTIDKERIRIGFNTKEYRTNDAPITIPLNIFEDGKEFLKLKWGDLSGLNVVSGGIEYITVYSGETAESISNNIGSIYSDNAKNTTTWRIDKPLVKTYYQIKVKLRDSEKPVESEIAVYDPSIVNVTPNKPLIYPKVKVAENKSILDIYWDTFVRPPYNKQEEDLANTGIFVDKKVTYDIWITDHRKNFNLQGLPKILDSVSAETLTQTEIDDVRTPVYNITSNKYYTVDNNGNFVEKEIEENKVYYIKIVAKKPISDTDSLDAPPSETQIYVVPRGDISSPNSLSKPPLRVKKDEKGNEMINKEDLTIQWNTKWYEIYDEATDSWYSSVAVEKGSLILGNNIKDTHNILNIYDLNSPTEVKAELKNAGYVNADNLIVRQIDISQPNIKYEIIVKTFDEINTSGGYQAYLETLLNSDSKDWKEISPTFNGNKYADYNIKELKPNTRYAILLRPYRILTDGRKDAYPTYILGTTLPQDTIVDITPISPTLKEFSKTDTSIEVYWKIDLEGISYELAINEILIDDPASSKLLIDPKEIATNGVKDTKDDIEYLKYNIKNLFPDTGYYIWIRAIVDGVDKKSEWSNPLYVRTELLKKPQPPSGLGLASEKSLEIYNSKNNTTYKSSTSNYLILEWLRDEEDTLKDTKADKLNKSEALIDSDITKTYMVKFNELLANKYYYVKAKTKVYISKSNDGKVEKAYSYILQFSQTEDFKDFLEIEVPTVKLSGDKILTNESDWTKDYRFRTKKSTNSDGDFDGGVDNEVYPLPKDDFEIFYEGDTKTLVYRFRSNQKDGSGNNDNLVDQRFITKLINQKVYDYKIDLTSHMGYNIKNRRVEIPYSILSAFEERKISLSILSNGTTFKLNAGFLNTPEVKKIGVDNKASVYIKIAENVGTSPIISYNQNYTSVPQELSLFINKNNANMPVSYLGTDMNVDIKLNSRATVLNNNVNVYRQDVATSSWKSVPSVYNSQKGSMALKTKALGNYSTIATSIQAVDTTGVLTSVNTKIMFTDLGNANLQTPVSVVQFNNIVSGVAKGKKQFPINIGLSTEDYNSLKNSGLLLNGSVVSVETATNILMKLYEMKTKSSYKPTTTVATTDFVNIKNVSKEYQTNLIKATELGFFEQNTNINPKSIMTLEQTLYIINIILDDSGY